MMRCTCCGRWTVEEITVQHVPGGPIFRRLRIKNGPYYIGDFTNPAEVAARLAREGVLDKMVEVSEPHSSSAT